MSAAAATRVALLTAAPARTVDEDLEPLRAALGERGAEVAITDWDDPTTDWRAFDRVVLRSTWDYTWRLTEFLERLDRIGAAARLSNPLPVVRWNCDKHYLGELVAAGLPVVPGVYVEPGADPRAGLQSLRDMHGGYDEVVAKPCVGAGSRGARRLPAAAGDTVVAHVGELQRQGHSVLLQPYLPAVDHGGETALLYFGGRFSHAIRKGPLLKTGQAPVRALFAAEHIVPRVPAADELEAAAAILAALPFPGPLLYARVDLIRDATGRPRLLELELIEPSLFLGRAPGAAGRYADAILAR